MHAPIVRIHPFMGGHKLIRLRLERRAPCTIIRSLIKFDNCYCKYNGHYRRMHGLQLAGIMAGVGGHKVTSYHTHSVQLRHGQQRKAMNLIIEIFMT